MADRWDQIRVPLARKFFLATIAQAATVIAGGLLLGWIFGRQAPSENLRLPLAFLVSSVLLAAGSVYLEIARGHVRREQQQQFRKSLLRALIFAMSFVSVQGYGLWAIDKGGTSAEASQLGVHGFVIMMTALHGMHFVVAQSILLWVTLSAFADRYDHEYSWGVTFAAGFWHILGLVWLCILFVFSTASVG
ncbi:MAG: cytochrome c oxidase subunit 3 [Planctomycetaceae bacterium]|jgi:cytochrome c oxidase subunit 3